MVNFLGLLMNPQINSVAVFEVMKDFRKGGLMPSNFEQFLEIVNSLPSLEIRTPADYLAFAPLALQNITDDEIRLIIREASRRNMAKVKQCWHPHASPATCSVNESGEILVSAAHSLQNNGILSKIAEDGQVMTHRLWQWKIEQRLFHKNSASVFYGFCNKHDAIFDPIEKTSYVSSQVQNFLFAYRAFCIAAHKKIEGSFLMDFGSKSDTDLQATRKIFDDAIVNENYDCIDSLVFELPAFYPIAVSAAFYVDFDFLGNEIQHSGERTELIYITLFPANNTSYFILSWLKDDAHVYKSLIEQLDTKEYTKTDISILIAAHCENVYFNPVYYKTFIEKYENVLAELIYITQMDIGQIGENGKIVNGKSQTPHDYLAGRYQINLFGY